MNKVKILRKKMNMSQKELAEKAGMAQSAIHYIESGLKSPTERTLQKLARALGVKPSDLLDDAAETPQATGTG